MTRVGRLTSRQLDIARLVARGLTNGEIAATLCISLSTVKTHLSSAQAKLDARNRVQVAARVWAADAAGPPPGHER